MSVQTIRAAVQPEHVLIPSCEHAVQFYENDSALVEAVAHHIGSALDAGDTTIVVATKAHRKALAEELCQRGIHLAAAREEGRYTELDASELLASFMVNGWPDKQRFAQTVGAIVAKAEAEARPEHRVAIFGEMVAVLWAAGHREAAVRLEELWNDLSRRHRFSLLCGYPIASFNRVEHRRLFFSICGEHSRVNPAESYPAEGSEKQRRRSVSRLQQRAKALETEIQLSQQRILLLQDVTNAGTWEMDMQEETFSFSSTAARMLSLQSGRVALSQLLGLMYYSGDRDAFLAGLQHARTGRRQFETVFRIRLGKRTRVLQIHGRTFYNAGFPLILGVLSDVTPSRKRQNKQAVGIHLV